MDTTTSLRVAHAYFDAWNNHDVPAIAALFGERGTFWDNQMSEAIPMKDLKAGFDGLLASTRNLKFVLVKSFAIDTNTAVVEWIMQGEKADGTPFAIPGIDVFEVEGDQIAAARAYMNPAQLS